MDRSWMKVNRLSIEYENGLKQFLDLAEKNLHDNNGIFWYPCKNYFDTKKHHRDVMFNHCGCDGQNYTKWVWHGEATKKRPLSHTVEDDEVMNDTLEDIIRDIGVDAFKNANMVDTL
ncbi:unnamed protein product [Lathyrus oleraceus]